MLGEIKKEVARGRIVKNLYLPEIEKMRLKNADVLNRYGNFGDDTCGAFVVNSPIDNAVILVVASAGVGWEHVSASRENRCPNWREMQFVKELFFNDDETAVEYHVAKAKHINIHACCLHLWRPTGEKISMPPAHLV